MSLMGRERSPDLRGCFKLNRPFQPQGQTKPDKTQGKQGAEEQEDEGKHQCLAFAVPIIRGNVYSLSCDLRD